MTQSNFGALIVDKLLFIDDQESVCFEFKRSFGDVFSIDTAKTREAALALIKDNDYNLAVIDVNLDEDERYNGLDLASELRVYSLLMSGADPEQSLYDEASSSEYVLGFLSKDTIFCDRLVERVKNAHEREKTTERLKANWWNNVVSQIRWAATNAKAISKKVETIEKKKSINIAIGILMSDYLMEQGDAIGYLDRMAYKENMTVFCAAKSVIKDKKHRIALKRQVDNEVLEKISDFSRKDVEKAISTLGLQETQALNRALGIQSKSEN
mgnify:CR=1 FL=1